MTLPYAEIVAQHQALQKEEAADASPERIERVKAFIAEVAAAGANIADPRQREQLRNFLRYWSAYVYDHTKEFPPSQLAPFLGTGTGGSRLGVRRLIVGLWIIVSIGLVLLVIVLLQGRFFGGTGGPGSTDTPGFISETIAPPTETPTPIATAMPATPEKLLPPKIKVQGDCLTEEQHVFFAVTNVGGDMYQPYTYKIYAQDESLVSTGSFSLKSGQSEQVSAAAIAGKMSFSAINDQGEKIVMTRVTCE